MKIELFDIDEYVELNKLDEVVSGVLFQRGGVPHPGGLVSREIFGISPKSRKDTYAYMDLHGHFFHPHVYKEIKRFARFVEKIVNGEEYYSIDSHGYLVKDDMNGQTGIEFLYENWDRINWKKDPKPGMRNERIDLVKKHSKNMVFVDKFLVIPAFYRDITSSSTGGGETSELNKLYARIIRYASIIKDQDVFDFQFHAANYGIQTTLVDIYDYFKVKLEKKHGLIRKYLLGKNVDYCTRTVITSSTFHANKPEDLKCDFRHCCIPLAQVCSLTYPFIVRYVKNFFDKELFENKNGKLVVNPQTGQVEKIDFPKNIESVFNDKYISRLINQFIRDPDSRFNKIEIPVEGGKKRYLYFSGKKFSPDKESESEIKGRPMTVCDLLYMAAYDATRDKHCIVTRYPLLDEFGIFIARVRVNSTVETQPVEINGEVYQYYPIVDLDCKPHDVPAKFNDTTNFSNSYLPGLDGDYDGDQVTVKILFSQEANAECEKVMNSKAYFINSEGKNIRKVSSEAIQTLYSMTKDPNVTGIKNRAISADEKKYLLDLKPEDITFELLVDLLGDYTDISDGKKRTTAKTPKFKCSDYFKLEKGEYFNTESIDTTVGKLLYNKIIVEGCKFEHVLGYVNFLITESGFKKIENAIAEALINETITVDQMYKFVDTRDWLGMQLHSVVTSSFTPDIVRIPPEVAAFKKKLIAENKEALDNGDYLVAEKIDNALIKKAKEVLKDDIGMDLYASGARGSFGNNYKNIYLSRGAVLNPFTGKYDIITNSLTEGLEKKDIATTSNVIVNGAYPKAVGTADSGYLAKKLIALLQTEVLAPAGSDCNSKGYLTVTLTAKNKNDYQERYILDGGHLVCLDTDHIDKYIGKTVKMRSPMYCTGVKGCLCNKCAGEFYYKIGKKNIGLAGPRVATTCTRLNMKKFHENIIKSTMIDPEDMFI